MLLTYLNEYNKETECPRRYHQWCYLSAIASMLGRNAWLEFGHRNMYPNMFIMLIGSPAARKNTAMNSSVDIIRLLDAINIAQGRTSKEKFLLDLSGHKDDTGTKHSAEAQLGGSKGGAAIVSKNLFDMDLAELDDVDEPHETLIAADEFTNFVGAGNYEFISLLGELWDNPPIYDVRVKNSKSYKISKPCINILGGNTPVGFATAFPPEMIGQGFISRLIVVYGERTKVQITWPEPPNIALREALAQHFMRIRMTVTGAVTVDKKGAAYEALDWIYKNWKALDDQRFASYSGRRFSHLLKLCMLFAADSYRNILTLDDVVAANTILTLTEHDMPRALGEFGRSRYSDVSNKILDYVAGCEVPPTIGKIWEHVSTDLEKQLALTDIITGLVRAQKLQSIKGGGFLPIRKPIQLDGKFFNLELIGGI